VPRLFVAVWPPDEVLDLVGALPRPEVPGLRWTTRDQWHVTLRFLGAVDDVAVVTDALAGLGSPAADAVAGPAVGRFGRRVLHIPVGGLDAVAGEVVARTAGIGSPPEDRVFHGHLTLARARDRRGVDLRRLCGLPFAAAWHAGEVCVVRSDLRPTGALYTVEARIPLDGP
jgi:RNA 2',3'-cyclic 3'-phosphodiesterase